MASTYTQHTLRQIFQSSFNMADWYLFMQNFFHATELKKTPEKISIHGGQEDGYYIELK